LLVRLVTNVLFRGVMIGCRQPPFVACQGRADYLVTVRETPPIDVYIQRRILTASQAELHEE
jgi:hypothetical protein